MNADRARRESTCRPAGVQTSLYIVKPEAMRHRHDIRSVLARHLEIGAWTTTVLPSEVLDAIYPDVSGDLRVMSHKAFKEQVEVGIVHGPNAIRTLLRIAGHETAPHLCSPNTIRHRFGRWAPSTCADGSLFYHNGIHRPKDAVEAVRHVELLLPRLKALRVSLGEFANDGPECGGA